MNILKNHNLDSDSLDIWRAFLSSLDEAQINDLKEIFNEDSSLIDTLTENIKTKRDAFLKNDYKLLDDILQKEESHPMLKN